MNVPIIDLLTEKDPVVGPPLVINMDSDVDRWKDLCEHLAQWNITPERFPAISGVKLPALPPSMSESPSSINLNLSHAAACRQRGLFEKRPFWLILEDDCRFLRDPRECIVQVLNTCQENNLDWSVVSLGCFSYDWQGKRQEFDYNGPAMLQKPVTGWYPWGSHSYLVNKKYGHRIIEKMSSCMCPADHVLLWEMNRGNGYLRRPSASYQEEYQSYRGGVATTKEAADMHPDIIKKITSGK